MSLVYDIIIISAEIETTKMCLLDVVSMDEYQFSKRVSEGGSIKIFDNPRLDS